MKRKSSFLLHFLIIIQNKIIEEKQKEIVDSINYAQNIQNAILPSLREIDDCFEDHFLLYEPKDIVAGDFYFYEAIGDRIIYAAADCTGHGVPGALMSVVCANALNRAVNEFALYEPGKILDKTRELVLNTFRKDGSSIKDGMNISLCCLKFEGPGSELENNINPVAATLQWSGANNPLWILRKESQAIEEIRPDKQPIGFSERLTPFKTHTLELKNGDAFFMFTDGLADQFGGEKGKKFKYRQLAEILLARRGGTGRTQNRARGTSGRSQGPRQVCAPQAVAVSATGPVRFHALREGGACCSRA